VKRAFREFSLPFNAMFLYAEAMGGYALGLIYWLVISRLAGADVLGTVSAMASFAILLGTLIRAGIPAGVTRFLGRSYAQRDSKEFSTFFTTSLILFWGSSVLGIALVLFFRSQLQGLTGLPIAFLYLACVIAFFAEMSLIPKSAFIAVMRGQIIILSTMLGGAARLGIGIGLVLLGWGALGAGIGYAVLPGVSLALLLSFLVKGPIPLTQSRWALDVKAAKEVTKASLVSWLPAVVLAVGSQLGILMVHAIQGAAQTGLYFIAFAILNAVLAIPFSIGMILLPVLSGMPDGRKRLTWKGIKMGLAITVPVTVSLFLCSKAILGLLGSEFLLAGNALLLLLASAVLIPIVRGIETLAYAYGRYKNVLLIGLSTNIPRVLLYVALVPLQGADGAAFAFLGGTVIGFICSTIIASNIGIHLLWKQILLIFSLPIGISAVIYFLQVHWILGVLSVLGVSFIGYLKLKIITRKEIREITSSLSLEPILEKVWPFKALLGD